MNLIIKRSVPVKRKAPEGWWSTYPEPETKELQNIEDDFSKLELEMLKEKIKDGVLKIGYFGWELKPDWLAKKIQYLIDGDEREKD